MSPQLEYILEYLLSDKVEVSDHALANFVSLVEGEAHVEQAPIYLLTATCNRVFKGDFEACRFEHALKALSQLDELERRRLDYIESAPQQMSKLIRETTKMFDYIWLALRRWIFIHEMQLTPFNTVNCLALSNVLFPRNGGMKEFKQYEPLLRQCNVLRMHAMRHLQSFPDLHNLKSLSEFRDIVPWRRAHIAMKRYLELTHEQIARIEEMIDPIPKQLRGYGIKRQDLVLDRITRHITATAALRSIRDSSPEL